MSLVLLSVNCSWPKVADNQRLQGDLTSALTTAAQELTRLNQEIKRAHSIRARLDQLQQKEWLKQRQESQARLHQAEEEMKVLGRRGDELRAQQADFAAFAHVHQKVFDRDPAWKQSMDWQNTIAAATANFNHQLEETSQAVQRIYTLWTEARLYQRHDTTEVAVKWSGDAVTWRSQLDELKNHYQAGQARLQSWYDRKPASQAMAARLSPLSDMNHDLIEMTQLCNRLESLRQDYANQFGRREEISNLDPEWPQWLEIQRRQGQLVSRLQNAQDRAAQAYARLLKAEGPMALGTDEGQTQSPQ